MDILLGKGEKMYYDKKKKKKGGQVDELAGQKKYIDIYIFRYSYFPKMRGVFLLFGAFLFSSSASAVKVGPCFVKMENRQFLTLLH